MMQFCELITGSVPMIDNRVVGAVPACDVVAASVDCQ